MSNSYFDWPAKTASERFVQLDTWRAADANAALDEVSAGLEKLPAPYDINAGRASYGTDTGTADAYVVALQTKAAAQVTSLQAGLHVSFLATNTNTGASTINVNGLGAKSILRPDGATALTAGAIVAGQMVECRYDGAAFQLLTGTDGSWTQDPSAIQKQTYTAFTTGGTGSAYTLTPSPVLSAYQANVSFYVNFHAACGTGATLSISGLATPPSLVKQLADGSYTTLLANDIPAGHRSRVTLLSATQALVEDMPPAGSSIYTTGGTSTAYTIAPAPAISAYTAGQSFMVNFNAASGNNPTLQISGIATPPNLVKLKGDGTYGNIKANELPSGLRARVTLISATQAVVDGYPFVKPAFSAYAGATQSPTSGADTKVQCNSEIYDTAGAYDPATYRFTAPVPGFYEFTGILQGGGTSCTSYIALLFKNGAIARGGDRLIIAANSDRQMVTVTDTLQLAAGDYVEFYGNVSGSAAQFIFTSAQLTSVFSGRFVRGE